MSWLSSILGLDASSNAGKAQAKANQYQGQAATGFQNLQNIGSGIPTGENSAILGLIGQLGNSAGVSTPFAGSGQTTYNSAAPQNTAPVTVGGVSQGGVPAQPSRPAQPQQSPYNLLPHQQERLNQSIDRINQQGQADLASLQSEFSKRGITDPRAMAAAHQQVQEHYAKLASEAETDFYEQARAEKEKALASLIQVLTGLYGEGTSGLASLGGAQQQTSLAYGQQSANALGGLLNLAGFGLGGGFNQPKVPTAQTGGYSPISYGGMGQYNPNEAIDPGIGSINYGAVEAANPHIFK